MPWTLAAALFFGGAFLANALPHLLVGLAGRRLPTPFASPPFRGLSPAAVNVAYGALNLGAAYLLLVRVGDLEQPTAAVVGFVAMTLQWARWTRKNRAAGHAFAPK